MAKQQNARPSAAAAIAGATGLVGSQLLPLLMQKYDPVAALTRRPLGISDPRLREVGLGSDPGIALEAGFCCLGTTIRKAGSQEAFRKVDFDAIVDFARQCKAAGARQFALVSSVGADPEAPNFYLRVKGQTERALSELGFESVYLFRPSFLTGNRGPDHRAGEKLGIAISTAVSPLLLGPLARYRAIDAGCVARAMFAAVAQPQQAGVRIIEYKEILRLCAL